jgi:hypothetical protein
VLNISHLLSPKEHAGRHADSVNFPFCATFLFIRIVLFGKMNTSEDEFPPEAAGSLLPSLAVEHHPPHNQRLFDKLVSDVEKILEGRPWSPFDPSPATISGPSRDDGRQQGRDSGMPPESRKENSRTEGGDREDTGKERLKGRKDTE